MEEIPQEFIDAAMRSEARLREHEKAAKILRAKGTDIEAANLSTITDLWITRHQSLEHILLPAVTMPKLRMLVLVGRMDVWTPEFVDKVRGIHILKIMDSSEVRLDFPHQSLLQLRHVFLDSLPKLVEIPEALTKRAIVNVQVIDCPLCKKEDIVGDFLADMRELPEVPPGEGNTEGKNKKSKACVVS